MFERSIICLITTILLCFNSIANQISLDSLKKDILQTTDADKRFAAAAELAGKYYYVHADSSLNYGNMALKMASELSNDKKAKAHYLLGRSLHVTSGIDTSITHLKAAVELIRSSEDNTLEADILLALGKTYNASGNTTKGIPLLLESLEMAELSGDYELIIRCKISLAEAYRVNYQMTEGLYVLREVEEFMSDKKVPKAILAYYYNRLAAIYNQLDNLDTALMYSETSVKISSSINHIPLMTSSYNEMGLIYEKMLMIDEALKYYRNSYKKQYNICHDIDAVTSEFNYAKLLSRQGEISKGNEILLRIVEVCKNSDWKQNLLAIYRQLGSNYKKIGDINNVEEYLWLAKEMELKLYKEAYSMDLAEVQARYNIGKKEKLIIEEKLKRELAETEARNRMQQRNIILVGTVILLFLIVTLYYSYQKTKKINVALLQKQTEVEIANKNLLIALNNKDSLMKELHHRVKNNIAIISGLLHLQEATIKDEAAKLLLKDSQNRIMSMAVVHDSLYKLENLSEIDCELFVAKLLKQIELSIGPPDKEIKQSVECRGLKIDIEQAIPLALIINELITNSYKYAFKNNNEGVIGVKLAGCEKKMVKLEIYDNGPGLPDGLENAGTGTLGLNLVKDLSDQLDGELTYHKKNEFSTFVLTFELKIT